MNLTERASIEALRKCLHSLEDTIASLVIMATALTERATRDLLFDEISKLDSIADVMRQALDAVQIQQSEETE